MLTSNGIIKKMKEAGWKKIRAEGSHAIFGHPEIPGRITLPVGSGLCILKLTSAIEKLCGCDLKRSGPRKK